jgi:hypothetical protein
MEDDLRLCARIDGRAKRVDAGCGPHLSRSRKVSREVASGAKTDRAQLRRLLDSLAPGDVVTVTPLDGPARSTRDLLNTLAAITEKKKAGSARSATHGPTRRRHTGVRCKLLLQEPPHVGDILRYQSRRDRSAHHGSTVIQHAPGQ